MKKLLLLIAGFTIFSISSFPKGNDKFDHQFYMAGGYTTTFLDRNQSNAFNIGGALHLGNTFFMPFTKIGNSLCFGLDVSYINFAYLPRNIAVQKGGLIIFSFAQFGPLASFSPVDDLHIEGFVTLKPSYAYNWYDLTDNVGNISTNREGGVNLLPAFGLNFRYSAFKLGAEVETGNRSLILYKNSTSSNLKLTYFTMWVGFSF